MMRSVVAQQEQVWRDFEARLMSLIEHLDSELQYPDGKKTHAEPSASSQAPDKVDTISTTQASNKTTTGSIPQTPETAGTHSISQVQVKVATGASLQTPGETATSSSSQAPDKAEIRSSPLAQGKTEKVKVPGALALYSEIRSSAMRIVDETSSLLRRLKDRIDKVDQDAERVQNLVPQYLDLKRSYASIKEANYTALLGAAVFGLSLVTVVFTPLSFAVALLALPSDGVYLNATDTIHMKRTIAKYTGKIEYPLCMA
jgi:hypothetical protein